MLSWSHNENQRHHICDIVYFRVDQLFWNFQNESLKLNSIQDYPAGQLAIQLARMLTFRKPISGQQCALLPSITKCHFFSRISFIYYNHACSLRSE